MKMDFLNSSMPFVVAATADFAMKSGVIATLNWELDNGEFLFQQRCGVGEVACMPRTGTRTRRRKYYLVLLATEKDQLTEHAIQDSIYSLICMVKGQKEASVAFPMVDVWYPSLYGTKPSTTTSGIRVLR